MEDLNNVTYTLNETESTEINRIYSVTIPLQYFKEWASKQSMQGFRPGKIPPRLLKKDIFLKDFGSKILNKIKKEIELDQIFASNYVIKTFDFDQDIEISLSIEKIPTLPELNFKNLQVQTFEVDISDENIKTAHENYAKINSKPNNDSENNEIDLNRKSQKGDFVSISIEIENINTHEIEKDYKTVILGSRSFIPAIEDALTNQKVGFTYEHKVNDNVIIKLTIDAIKESIPLSDEEIRNYLNIDDATTLESFFKKKLKEESEVASKNLILESIRKYILELPFEVPLSSIQKEFQKIWDNYMANFNYVEGLDLNEFIKNKTGLSREEFEKNIANIATMQAKIKFVYYTIAQKENLKITDSEIYDAINSQIHFFNNNLEKAKSFYENNHEAKEEMLEGILFRKISEKLISNVQKEEPKNISLEELYAIKPEQLEYKIVGEIKDKIADDKANG